MKLPLEASQRRQVLSPAHASIKRLFDIVLSLLLSPVLLPVAGLLILIARRSTGESGLFCQQRVGQFGDTFKLYKIRSMRSLAGVSTHVTTSADARITPFGRFLRKTKLDEVPQLINVLRGDMSFVGPRPDMPESYVTLDDSAAPVLCLRPGITGPASIAYRHEEDLLRQQANPEAYNRDVIFPDKIRINLDYIKNYSLSADIGLIVKTALGR